MIKKAEEEYNFTQRSSNKINEYNCLLRYIENLKKDVNRQMMMWNTFYRKIITILKTNTLRVFEPLT